MLAADIRPHVLRYERQIESPTHATGFGGEEASNRWSALLAEIRYRNLTVSTNWRASSR